MRTLGIALAALPLFALGCRTNPNQVLLEQESRLLEDRVYHLQALLEDCHAAREATLRENESLKAEMANGAKQSSVEPPGSTPPRGNRRQPPPVLEAPTIELPEPSDSPEVELPPAGGESAGGSPPTQLIINKRLTGGLDRDGQNGDEGLMVVVEPRDASGRLVKEPGAMSVVLMDPSQQGEATRVARWDFAAGEVSGLFRDTSSGRGLQFELPWPKEPPKNRALRLFVRCTTADGKKITSEAPVEVRAAGDPPRISSDGKDWSRSESARRAPERRPPSSRLKSSRPASRRERLSANEADDRPETDPDADRSRGRQSARQAALPDAPAWKPYR
jgi:hypothetical protein